MGIVRHLQLRLNKVSELIHNSTYHQNLPMAKVSVHFVDIIDKVRPVFRLAARPQAGRLLPAAAGLLRCCRVRGMRRRDSILQSQCRFSTEIWQQDVSL